MHRRRYRAKKYWATSVALVALLLGSGTVAAPAEAATPTPASVAAAAYARMSTSQRIGQLLMAAVPETGSTAAARTVLARYHVGNVVLVGASSAGTAGVAARVAPVRQVTMQAAVLPFVAADQEGGYVQHLKGTGFSSISDRTAAGAAPDRDPASRLAGVGGAVAPGRGEPGSGAGGRRRAGRRSAPATSRSAATTGSTATRRVSSART